MDIIYLEDSEDFDSYSQDGQWTLIEKDEGVDFSLFYTKTAVDRLPVTSTKVTSKPCIDPDATMDIRRYFERERDKNLKACSIDPILNVQVDPRYRSVGL